ncbi:MAG: WYL domain-containing protein [Spirochaetes bacterium]|jgi:hypothetical protein|nr:WYL domain-containing protein [Spirochaetota bacterium]
MSDKQILGETTQIDILRRYLHVIALLQNRDDKWNNGTLAETLSEDPNGKSLLSDSHIKHCTEEYIEKELGLTLTRRKGARSFTFEKPIEKDLLLKLINIYSIFVIEDIQKDIALQSLVEKYPEQCLWLLGRLFFAKIQNNIVEFTYTNNKGIKQQVTCHPYHIIFKNNNLYLVALREYDGVVCLYIVNRINDLKVKDKKFIEEIPDSASYFKNSISSYISNRPPVRVILKFKKELRNNINDILAGIDAEIEDKDDHCIAECLLNDTMYLCKQLFLYGGGVEIIKPDSIRNEMTAMLKKSLSVYQ